MPTGHYRFRPSFGNVGSLFRGARRDTYPLNQNLLDQYPGAASAYSLQVLSSDFSDSDVIIARRTDNAELGFTADQITNGDLETWAGVGDAFVKTLYDQSGNVGDATQTDPTKQPKIVSSGTLITDNNGKATMEFDGTDDFFWITYSDFGTSDFYMVAVANNAVAGSTRYLATIGRGGAGQEWSGLLDSGATDPSLDLSGFMDDDVTNLRNDSGLGDKDETFIFSLQRDTNTSRVRVDGTSSDLDITGLGSLTNTNAEAVLGGFTTNGILAISTWSGTISEFIVYASDQSDNIDLIESNIAERHSVTSFP